MKMVQMKSKLSRRQSPTQSVAKKHLKMHLKRIRNREYSRLRDMVPSIATKDKVSKVTVIEEAVKYIDELHKALFERLQSKGLQNAPSSEDDVKDFIQNMMPPNLFSRTDSTPCQFEKQQRVPSYLFQRKHKGSRKNEVHDKFTRRRINSPTLSVTFTTRSFSSYSLFHINMISDESVQRSSFNE